MAEKITKIASSYDMVSIMRDIGANYFGSDLSEQRIGMFGYLTESAANMFGAAILDASNRQQEYNSCTAKKRSTLLYEGSKLDVNIDNATPAKMSAYVGILTTSIINPSHNGGFGTPIAKSNANQEKHDYLLVLEKDTVINIGNYDFMFEHDIKIRATYNIMTNSYSYSVKYLFEGDVDETSLKGSYPDGYTIPRYVTAYDTDDKYIQSYVQNYNKDISILLFKIDLVQISKESTTYPIVKNDIISLTGIDFPFSNELSHFNIFYRKNINSSWENILAIPIYQSNDSYNEDVIFYETLHDEKKIRLTMSDFVPAYNSELRIDIYNTMGSEVNDLIYSGDGSDISITLNSFEERHSYTGLELNCKPISSAYGGSDTPTLEELRAKVINAKSTVNSINTDYDLINFMKARDDTNDCVFVKKRNDIIERRYSCFMIPRLIKKDIIPTSTLDLCIPNFKSTIDTEAHTYYNFIQASNMSSLKDPLYYASSDTSFRGKYNYNDMGDIKGENDTGVDFYSISESYYSNLLNKNIDEILINTTYKPYAVGNINYTKSDQYISLRQYLSSIDIEIDGETTLDKIVDTKFKNPIEIMAISDTYKLKYSKSKLLQNTLHYDLTTRRFMDESSIYEDDNKIPNKFKLKGKIYTCEVNDSGVYLADNTENPLFYYNPLKSYKIEELYFAIKDNSGEFVKEDNSYIKSSDTSYIGDRYKIINLSSINIENYEYDLDSSNIITYMTDNGEATSQILLSSSENEYYSPYSDDTIRYSFVDNYIDYNDDPSSIDDTYLNNSGYYYKVSDLEPGTLYNKPTMFIPLKEYLNDYNVDVLNEYMIKELSTYYIANENPTVSGEYIMICTNTIDKAQGEYIYYYKFVEEVTVKDIPLYIAVNQNKKYSNVVENKYRYYIQNIDDTNPEKYIYKKLYYRETKNTPDDVGLYIYDYESNNYVRQIDDYTIDGIVFSVDSNGNKINLTVKAGTPLILKQDIEKHNGLEDNQFDITLPSYQYPIVSINDFYNTDTYSDEGKKFNTLNSLMVLNMNERIVNSDGKIINKYMVDKNRGLYWAKDGVSLENVMKVYSLPYTIVYNIQNQIASFFLTSISRDVNMNMIEEETEKSPVNFAIDTIHIERNSALEDDSVYNISVTVMTNGDISNAKLDKIIESGTITETNIGQTAGSIMLKGFIYDTDDTLKGYFDLDYDTSVSHSTEDMFTFKGKIKINDSISSTYFTNMKNMYAVSGLECDSGESFTDEYDNTYYLPTNIKHEDEFLNLKIENLRIAIGCYYINRTVIDNINYLNENGKPYKIDDIASIDTSEMEIKPIISNMNTRDILVDTVGNGVLTYPQFAAKSKYTFKDGTKIDDVPDRYILTNVYDNSIDLINIYTDMSNFVKSSVQINEIKEDINKNNINTLEMIHFTDIPVVQFSQCLSDTISDRITNVISDTNENLTDLSMHITNNFSIDYKFFRTYGPCRYFKLRSLTPHDEKDPDTGVVTHYDYTDTPLGNLDITIRFNLLIKNNLSISDNEVISQLRSYIKARIEELNNETDNDDYAIYISNIITDIENEFNDYVRSIELVSINGNDSDFRIIEYNKPDFTDVSYYNSTTETKDIKEYVPEYINVPLNNITIDIRR